jgi:hypothetical protein
MVKQLERLSTCKILAIKSEGKQSLGISSHRWNYIEMDFEELGWEVKDCIHMA